MASARSIVFTAGGKPQEAKDADTQIVSGTIQNGSGSLTINCAATSIIFQVGGATQATLAANNLTLPSTITVNRVYSNTGDLQLNAIVGQIIKLEVDTTAVLTIDAAAITAAQPIAMSGQKITGMAQGTATSEALAYPWIGSVSGSASLSSTPFTLNQTTTTFQAIGLSVALPSAGTYKVTATVRASISESSGPGAFIIGALYNSTDSAYITNSERILAQANSLNVLQQTTTIIEELITVAAAKTIEVRCCRVFSGTILSSTIDSDANGRCRMTYVKLHDA